MANCIFGWPIYSDVGVTYTPTLSGGTWSSSLPLTNLQDRRLAKVARSSNATAAATQFDVDLGVARTVGLVAIPKHTMTSAGTVRVRGYTSAGHAGNVYDSGTLTPWPAGLTAEDVNGLNIPFVVLPATSARYWWVELTDTANPAGYVDVARLVIAGAYTPAINMSYGAALGLETETSRTVTDGGAALYNERPVRRIVTGVLDHLTDAEGLASFLRMQHQLGTAGQLFFMWDSADTTYKWTRSFLAVHRTLSALEQPYVSRHRGAFQLVEEL